MQRLFLLMFIGLLAVNSPSIADEASSGKTANGDAEELRNEIKKVAQEVRTLAKRVEEKSEEVGTKVKSDVRAGMINLLKETQKTLQEMTEALEEGAEKK